MWISKLNIFFSMNFWVQVWLMCIALWGLHQPSVHRSDLTWIGLTEVYLGSGEDRRPSVWFTRCGKWSTHPAGWLYRHTTVGLVSVKSHWFLFCINKKGWRIKRDKMTWNCWYSWVCACACTCLVFSMQTWLIWLGDRLLFCHLKWKWD